MEKNNMFYLVTDHILHTEVMPLRKTSNFTIFANRADAYDYGCILYLKYLPKTQQEFITYPDREQLFNVLMKRAELLRSDIDVDIFELPLKSKLNPNTPAYVPTGTSPTNFSFFGKT
jgi:hypothetical protein